MNNGVKELAKSASRACALGSFYGKFISAGGMSYSVNPKLYSTMVEPVLMYGAGIWGTKPFSCINSVKKSNKNVPSCRIIHIEYSC